MSVRPGSISLSPLGGALVSSEEKSFRRILAAHTNRYPELEIQDLYKLMYQAVMGSEHAVSDTTEARIWLERELKTLTEGPVEPVIETISGEGRIARVNLRPYLAAKGNVDALIDAFVRTGDEHRGARAGLKRYCSYLEGAANVGSLPFTLNALRGFFVRMEAQGFPGVHHSTTYRASYSPAYRVIVLDFLVRE